MVMDKDLVEAIQPFEKVGLYFIEDVVKWTMQKARKSMETVISRHMRGQWFKFPPDGKSKLRVRPIPPQLPEIIAAGNPEDIEKKLMEAEAFRIFSLSLIAWKNVVDAEGKPWPLTEDVKRKIYLGDPGIVEFVLEKNSELARKMTAEYKRLECQLVKGFEKKIQKRVKQHFGGV